MELMNLELEVVKEVAEQHDDKQLRTLIDLELALVGGGSGDVTFG